MTNFFQGLIAVGYLVIMVGAIRLWWVLPVERRMFAPLVAFSAAVWVVVYGASALDLVFMRHILSNFGHFLNITILVLWIHAASLTALQDRAAKEEVEKWIQ